MFKEIGYIHITLSQSFDESIDAERWNVSFVTDTHYHDILPTPSFLLNLSIFYHNHPYSCLRK